LKTWRILAQQMALVRLMQCLAAVPKRLGQQIVALEERRHRLATAFLLFDQRSIHHENRWHQHSDLQLIEKDAGL